MNCKFTYSRLIITWFFLIKYYFSYSTKNKGPGTVGLSFITMTLLRGLRSKCTVLMAFLRSYGEFTLYACMPCINKVAFFRYIFSFSYTLKSTGYNKLPITNDSEVIFKVIKKRENSIGERFSPWRRPLLQAKGLDITHYKAWQYVGLQKFETRYWNNVIGTQQLRPEQS